MIMKLKILSVVIAALVFSVIINGCLIESVDQSTTVKQGDTFSTTIVISDITADANPHEGAVDVLVPDDWTFKSGTYSFSGGNGNMIVDTAIIPVYGNVDSAIPPPMNMKWLKLLSDKAYSNPANALYQVELKLNVGQKTGDFPIGYLTTKNSEKLLVFNTQDVDNSSAWTDTSMNHMVTVSPATGVEETKLTGIPTEYLLSQNFPNPFNPSTTINYSIVKEGNVNITVYNSLGKEVEVLADSYKSAGNYSVKFSNTNLSSGIYYYKINSDNFTQTKKMILLK